MRQETYTRYRLRSKEQFRKYLEIEKTLFKKEWRWILVGALMQYFHSIGTNVAYNIQNQLSVEQRFPLYDLGYELMPQLSDANAVISEVLVFGGIFLPTLVLFATIPLFCQNPSQPRYLTLTLKRVLVALSIAQVFRITSFLCTALPGSAPHCEPKFNDTCLASLPESSPRANCVIPNEEFKPPETLTDFIFRVDAFSGCGDLMFSSHTIYTLTFILTVCKFWYHLYLVIYMVSIQIIIAFLIIASRKHYTIDVYTALYVVPMIWFLLDAYHKDINCKDIGISAESLEKQYGVQFKDEMEEQSIESPRVNEQPMTPKGDVHFDKV